MEKHFVILFDDYINKRTVGLHKHYDNCGIPVGYLECIELLKSEFPHLDFDYSSIVTDSIYADSISKYDSYYEDVFFIEYENIDYFIECVRANLKVRAVDVVNIILSQCMLDNDRLFDLLDKVKREYNIRYGEMLFNETDYSELRNRSMHILTDFEKAIIWCRFRKFANYEKIIDTLNYVLDFNKTPDYLF